VVGHFISPSFNVFTLEDICESRVFIRGRHFTWQFQELVYNTVNVTGREIYVMDQMRIRTQAP
jgi:hypothetical protein